MKKEIFIIIMDRSLSVQEKIEKILKIDSNIFQTKSFFDYNTVKKNHRALLRDTKELIYFFLQISYILFKQKDLAKTKVFLVKFYEEYKEFLSYKDETNVLDNLSNCYRSAGYFEKTILFLSRAFELSKQAKNQQDMIYFASSLGNAYFHFDKYSKALEMQKLAYRISKETNSILNMSVTLNNIGNVYMRLSNYEKALENYLQSLHIKERFVNDEKIARSLNNIGNVYFRLEKFGKAKDCFLQVLKIYRKAKNQPGIATTYNNLGTLFDQLKEYEQALQYHQKSWKIREKLGNKLEISVTLNNIGNVLKNQEKYLESLEHYHQALEIKREINDNLGMVIVLSNIGSSYLHLKEIRKAYSYLEEALQLAEMIDSKEMLSIIFGQLANYFDLIENFQKALFYQRKYTEVQKRIQHEKLSKRLAKLQLNFEIEQKEKEKEIDHLKNIADKYSLISKDLEANVKGTFIGESKKIKAILDFTINVAEYQDSNVLITGESGTGKEMIARIIHFASSRREFNFCPVNCSAIPETLLESEFFGHKKGTFTGAINDKKGLFELAHHGTLFLDEIADMPLNLQSKLLRAIEEKKIKKIGWEKELSIDARIISASNQNIKELVDKKEFRLDLFHRLNTIVIEIPPLRDRPEDIEPLLKYFLENLTKKMKKPLPKIEQNVFSKLQNYHFPGNVRELKNLVERAVIISKNNILNEDCFPLSESEKNAVTITNFNIKDNEKLLIEAALQKTDFNKSKAARLLGISRHTLLRRLAEYKL